MGRHAVDIWLRRHAALVDACVAAVLLLVLGLPWYLTSGGSPVVAALSLGLLGPLALRRTRPVLAAGAVFVVAFLQVVVGEPLSPADLAVPVAVHSITTYGPRWAGLAGLATGLLGAVLAALGVYGRFGGNDGPLAFVFSSGAFGSLILASWAAGALRRVRREQVEQLRERAHRLEVERDQESRLAAAAERARIARELHDIVAHSLSVIVAQADGGTYAGRSSPEAATAALGTVAATGRQALGDMRRLLGVLRTADPNGLAPLPDVGAVGDLVAGVRGSGVAVALDVVGAPRPLPPGAGLAAYRIVQEALTNVLKHAGPGAVAAVRLTWTRDALELTVSDDGGAAAPPAAEPDVPSGQGITGMAERAALYGGSVQAVPREGGFTLHATLPYPGTAP
jgi:signal transduction histidine kinase